MAGDVGSQTELGPIFIFGLSDALTLRFEIATERI